MLGIGGEAGRPAEAAGLIELGLRVRFPHPLVRSAVYRAADPSDRRDVHRALAEATDPVVDPDRRAWHRAHATATPDEAVAAEMVRSADRAQGRGGLAAAAAFLERAAELTPDPAVRVERALAAAQAKLDVADAASASDLLAAAELGPVDELQRARLERLRAQIAFASRRGRDAPPLLLEAARRLDPLDAAMARETYLEAIAAAMFAGRLGTGPDEREVAEAARASNRAPAPGAADLLLDALATRFTEGYAAAVAPLSRALRAFAEPDGGGRTALAVAGVPPRAGSLGRRALARARDPRRARRARHRRAQPAPGRANYLAALNVHSGAFATAAALIEEVDAITQATGLPPLKYAACMLAAARGDEAQAQALVDGARRERDGARRGLGGRRSSVARRAAAQRPRPLRRGARGRAAGVRARGRRDVRLGAGGADRGRRARRPAGRGRRRARAPERAHAGERHRMGARDRGALPRAAERRRVASTASRSSGSRAAARRVELARSRLLYGEWLRRENRRMDAREQLRAAHESFSQMGAEAFAERARRELLATGETARRLTPETRDVLTPQEVQVARLARDGHTNPEIGAQLFISPRTVEYHLRKVFRKLDVSTRKELRAALAGQVRSGRLGLRVAEPAPRLPLPDRERGKQRRDDEAQHKCADLVAQGDEQDEQRRDHHAFRVRLAGHPPAEQALSEQVQRGPAEDHRRADRARRVVGRLDQQVAGDRGRDDARDDRQVSVGVGVAREATGVVERRGACRARARSIDRSTATTARRSRRTRR